MIIYGSCGLSKFCLSTSCYFFLLILCIVFVFFIINTLYCVCILFVLIFFFIFLNYFGFWAHAAVYTTRTLFLNYTLICFLLISFINAKTLFFIRLLSTYHVCIGDELIRFNQGFVSNNSSVFHSSSICSAIDF